LTVDEKRHELAQYRLKQAVESLEEAVRTFRSRLREDLKNPEFKVHYQEERQAHMLAMKIARLCEKKGLSQQ